MTVRANKQIWRLAEWLYREVYEPSPWNLYQRSKLVQCELYDKAAELLKKLQNNEFTSEDNHGD